MVKKSFGIFSTLLVFISLLAACDNARNRNVTFDVPYSGPLASIASSSVLAIPSSHSILLTWKNPVITDAILEIERLEIEWMSESDSGDEGNGVKTNGTEANMSASFEILNLATDVTYLLTLKVVYNFGSSDGTEIRVLTGKNEDGDKVVDTDDNCPTIANSDQADLDKDEVGDVCDNCPLDFNRDQANFNNLTDESGDACGDADDDGVADADDNCRLDFNPDQANFNNLTDATGDVCGDADGDGHVDADDSDRDNDSLIEVWTLEDLAGLRDDLDGDGADDHRFDDATDNVTPRGNEGCPAAGCIGYELGRSLDFADAASYTTSYANATVDMNAWTSGRRLGSDWFLYIFGYLQSLYAGVFEGNGHRISNLLVAADARQVGVGLFGAASGALRNLRIVAADIRNGLSAVGILAGSARAMHGLTMFRRKGACSVPTNSTGVGGLLGDARNATVRFSSAAGSVRGGDAVGGLIGDGGDARINFSFAAVTLINGRDRVGGLVGDGRGATMVAASAFDGPVRGESMRWAVWLADGSRSFVAASFASGCCGVG